MKISVAVFMLMAIVAFVMVGCSESASPLLPPTDNSSPTHTVPASLAKGGAIVHSATGGGQLKDLTGGGYWNTMSFSATLGSDGTSSGQVQLVDHTGFFKEVTGKGPEAHGTVYGLKVIDNKAKICWMFTSGLWKGQHGYTVVRDNGEGTNAWGSDENSGILWTDGSDIFGEATIAELDAMDPDEFISWLVDDLFPHLDLPPGFSPWAPFTQGNVQVR